MFSYKTFFSMHRVGQVPNLARGYAFPARKGAMIFAKRYELNYRRRRIVCLTIT